MTRLRRDETHAWAEWVNARYETVSVRHRRGVHLTRPDMAATLCLRYALRDGAPDRFRLCAQCRAGAKVAYAMRQPRQARWRDGTPIEGATA